MAGIPPVLDTDPEDVAWALQTADALWNRAERADALVWLRRAAQAAAELEEDDRALALARDAAELTEWAERQGGGHGASRPPPPPPRPVKSTDLVDELLQLGAGDSVDDATMPEITLEPDVLEPIIETIRAPAFQQPFLGGPFLPAPSANPPSLSIAPFLRSARKRADAATEPAPSSETPASTAVAAPATQVPAHAAADPETASDSGRVSRLPWRGHAKRAGGQSSVPSAAPKGTPPAGTPRTQVPPPLPTTASPIALAPVTAPPAHPARPLSPGAPSAAELRAGMLDPWSETGGRVGDTSRPLRPAAMAEFDSDEIVTSAPPVSQPPAPMRMASPARTDRTPEVLALPLTIVPEELDLSSVEALGDMPDDAREAFARNATLRSLVRGEKVTGFALALVIHGAVNVVGAGNDAVALQLEAGTVVRARGTLQPSLPLRLIVASEQARVALWGERDVVVAFRAFPWVEDELRAAGDRVQALVGLTLGQLGERFDLALRTLVTRRLEVRVLAENEVVARAGEPIRGILVVGAGELELLSAKGIPTGAVLRPGDFVFASEVLRAAPAPNDVRAGKGGALVLFADRGVAQELLVTCPPLLEIFAG